MSGTLCGKPEPRNYYPMPNAVFSLGLKPGELAVYSYLMYIYVYGRTQKELLEKLHRSITVYDGAELIEDGKLPLGEWLDRWLDEYAPATSRPGTLDGYRTYAENYIKPILGKKKISSITTADIQIHGADHRPATR